MHPDGYIQLKDRSKDIIISGGENISSIEVEDALYKHPAVASCGVVARPDEKWGETPVAYVELKPGTTATRGRDHRALPQAARPLQVPEDGGLRRNPEDLDGQDPEVPAARNGQGGVAARGLRDFVIQGGAGAKRRCGDPGIHAVIWRRCSSGREWLSSDGRNLLIRCILWPTSRHGSEGLRRVATLLASPYDDDGTGGDSPTLRRFCLHDQVSPSVTNYTRTSESALTSRLFNLRLTKI